MRLLTVEEAATRLGMRPATLRDWILKRRLATVKLGPSGPSAVRIEEAELERFVAAHRRPAWVEKPRRRAAS